MECIFKYSESTIKPLSIEFGNNIVFIRKNITPKERTDTLGSTIYWTYQEAKMSPKAFNEYSNYIITQNAINGEYDSQNILQIITGQENGDNNQLIIMEAIADLYDIITSLM